MVLKERGWSRKDHPTSDVRESTKRRERPTSRITARTKLQRESTSFPGESFSHKGQVFERQGQVLPYLRPSLCDVDCPMWLKEESLKDVDGRRRHVGLPL